MTCCVPSSSASSRLSIRPSAGDRAGIDATDVFAHLGSAQHFYKAFMGPNGGSAPHVLRECFEARIRQILVLDPLASASFKESITARFVASSLMAVLECWMERGARETPQQVQATFADLVGPGLNSSGRRLH